MRDLAEGTWGDCAEPLVAEQEEAARWKKN